MEKPCYLLYSTMTKNNSKFASRLFTEINHSRSSQEGISSSRRTTMTPLEEYEAWQAYGKQLTRLKKEREKAK
jgi:hypothetical protein